MEETLKTTFSKNLKLILNIEGRDTNKKARDISEKAKKAGYPIAVRTIKYAIDSNVSIGLDKMQAISAGLGIPLWVMLIPDMDIDSIEILPEIVNNYKSSGLDERKFIIQAAQNAAK